MYDFHYDYIWVTHSSGAKLLFTDTDSLIYEIETDDVYDDFYEDRSLFDFSYYPKDLRFYDPVKKNLIGKMKDVIEMKI